MEGSSSRCLICLEEERATFSLAEDNVLRQYVEELIGISVELVAGAKSADLCRECKEKLCQFNQFKRMAMENQTRFLHVGDIFVKSEPTNDIDTSDTSDCVETTLCDDGNNGGENGQNGEAISNEISFFPQPPCKKKVGRVKGTVNTHLENPFKCGECGLRYSSINSLQKHAEGDHPEAGIKCMACNFILFGATTLGYHQEICHFFLGKAKQEFLCHVCSRKFTSRAILTKHLKMCGKDDAFRCRKCYRMFDRVVFVNEHEKLCEQGLSDSNGTDIEENLKLLTPTIDIKQEVEDGDPRNGFSSEIPKRKKKDKSEYYKMGTFLCAECEFSTTNFKSLDNHCRTKHPDIKRQCDGCLKLFCGEGTVAAHMEMCKFVQEDVETFWQCDKECRQRFDKLASWAAHTKKCSGEEKLFTCPKCNRQLQRGSTKSAHIKKCDGSRSNYSCCNTDFASFKPFLMHKRMKHGFTVDENSCQCPICPEKVLKTPTLMMMHLRNLHFSRKCQETYPCPISGCGKILQQLKSVAKHLKTHEERENREVFLCNVCDKHFLSEKAKEKHRKDYHQSYVDTNEDDTKGSYELDMVFDNDDDLYELSIPITDIQNGSEKYDSSDVVFNCPDCEETFNAHTEMLHHQSDVHKGWYECG